MNSAVIYYISTIVILSISSLINVSKIMKCFIIFLILFFTIGGSHFNGADWINYTSVYDKLKDYSWGEVLLNPPFEILFSLIIKFFSSNEFDYQVMISVIAFFNIILIIYISYKVEVKNIFFLFIIIFLIQGWSLFQEQIRQSIAIVICLYSIYQYLGLNKKTAYFWILIAMGFHGSSIFAVVYFYVANKIIKNNGLPLSLSNFKFVISFLIILLIFLNYFTKVIPFESVLPSLWWQKLNYYINDEESVSSVLTLGLISYPIGFFLLFIRRNYVANRKSNWLSFAWSMAMIWCLVGPFLRVAAIFTRFEHYFLILIPFALVSYEWKNQRNLFDFPSVKLIQIVFALTFTVRLLVQPAQTVWVENYQNSFATYFFDNEIEEKELRKEKVCEMQLNYGSDVCGLLDQ